MRRVMLVIGLLVLVVAAWAQPTPTTQVELVLDASGSMWSRGLDGSYRIDAARQALSAFIRGLPDAGVDVGLRIYGSRVGALDAGACDDTALFVPLAAVDKAALQATVDAVKARGATPIVRSLHAAVGDFTGTGRHLIVLVTDGEEGCGGDLAAGLAELRGAQPPVELRVIGLDLTDRATRAFGEVATFVNANDAASLAAALAGAVKDVMPAAAPAPVPAAVTLDAPSEVPAGTAYVVRWQGTPVAGDAIVTVPADAPDEAAGDLVGYVKGVSQLPAVAPLEPTTLELRYLSVGTIAARRTLTVTPSPATLKVTDEAVFAGGRFSVAWTGPNGPKDYVTVVAPDAPDGSYQDYHYTREGARLAFTAPSDAGEYELRYQSDDDPGKVLARTRFEVLPPKPITIEATGEVIAGADFQVRWTGPDAVQDYITIVPKGTPEGTYASYAYTAAGPTLTLRAPLEPGEYELRYSTDRSDAHGRVYASYPIRVVAAAIAMTPAPHVRAGSRFDVAVTGPANQSDYVTLVPASARDGEYAAYDYVREPQTTVTLQAPMQPGAYELRYQNDREPSRVLARVALTLEPGVAVAIEAPGTAQAGGNIEVRWTGPDGPSDYLTIVPAGAADGEYGPYTYTRVGSPLQLQVPKEPGAYEIRYQSDRSGVGVLARRPLTVR